MKKIYLFMKNEQLQQTFIDSEELEAETSFDCETDIIQKVSEDLKRAMEELE